MGMIRNTKTILDYAPNFYSGIASVLMPRKKYKQLCELVKSMKQEDGLYEDWRAVGNDLRSAMNKFNAEMAWQRK